MRLLLLYLSLPVVGFTLLVISTTSHILRFGTVPGSMVAGLCITGVFLWLVADAVDREVEPKVTTCRSRHSAGFSVIDLKK